MVACTLTVIPTSLAVWCCGQVACLVPQGPGLKLGRVTAQAVRDTSVLQVNLEAQELRSVALREQDQSHKQRLESLESLIKVSTSGSASTSKHLLPVEEEAKYIIVCKHC